MSRLDELQIERATVVDRLDMVKRSIARLDDRLTVTMPHGEYTALSEERTATIETLQSLERKAGELNREIRRERERESSAEAGVSADDTSALLRVAAQIIGQIDYDDLTDAERSFLYVLQQRVDADSKRLRRLKTTPTIGDVVSRRGSL